MTTHFAAAYNTESNGCAQEVMPDWRLGRILCDFWTTADVFCCTASILNIAAIALDRYWLITRNVSYTHARRMPRRRACRLMAAAAWSTSAIISVAPLLGWRTGIIIRPHRVHEMRPFAIDDPVAWALGGQSVCRSRGRLFARWQPDAAVTTLLRPLVITIIIV